VTSDREYTPSRVCPHPCGQTNGRFVFRAWPSRKRQTGTRAEAPQAHRFREAARRKRRAEEATAVSRESMRSNGAAPAVVTGRQRIRRCQGIESQVTAAPHCGGEAVELVRRLAGESLESSSEPGATEVGALVPTPLRTGVPDPGSGLHKADAPLSSESAKRPPLCPPFEVRCACTSHHATQGLVSDPTLARRGMMDAASSGTTLSKCRRRSGRQAGPHLSCPDAHPTGCRSSGCPCSQPMTTPPWGA